MPGDFKDTIKSVAINLATLKVTTCVGEIHAKRGDADSVGRTLIEPAWKPENTRILRTEINLIDGDAGNFLHEDFVGDGDAAVMREYHERQVVRAQDVVQRNVQLMMTLGDKFGKLLGVDDQ